MTFTDDLDHLDDADDLFFGWPELDEEGHVDVEGSDDPSVVEASLAALLKQLEQEDQEEQQSLQNLFEIWINFLMTTNPNN